MANSPDRLDEVRRAAQRHEGLDAPAVGFHGGRLRGPSEMGSGRRRRVEDHHARGSRRTRPANPPPRGRRLWTTPRRREAARARRQGGAARGQNARGRDPSGGRQAHGGGRRAATRGGRPSPQPTLRPGVGRRRRQGDASRLAGRRTAGRVDLQRQGSDRLVSPKKETPPGAPRADTWSSNRAAGVSCAARRNTATSRCRWSTRCKREATRD